MKRANLQDIVGSTVGRLYVEEYIGKVSTDNINYYHKYRCLCECGNRKDIARNSLLPSGNSRSCGCLGKECTISRSKTHGMTKTLTYKSWLKMKERCYYENSNRYEHYGGNGITVCDRWLESFENFFEDMGERPDNSYSLDRVDVKENYCKNNCRWATTKQQARNKGKSKSNKSGVTGVYIRKDSEGEEKYCVAFWTDSCNKGRSKSFSIKVYGKELALSLAKKTRNEKISLYEGEDSYGEHHGI